MAAGLGFKDFVTGEVLTAADVDGYLMQGVWVFASAAARTAAVTSPQEGNMSYLKDTNSTEYYSGSAWVAVGASTPTNPAFRAYRNTSVQTLNVNTITKVQLNAEDYDTANCFDSTTNYRFTPNVAGYYQFNGKVYFDNTGTSHRFFAYLYKNGSNYATFDLTNGNPYGSVGGSDLIYLNGSTDYVELYAQTSSTTTRTIYFGSDSTSLSGVWIRS